MAVSRVSASNASADSCDRGNSDGAGVNQMRQTSCANQVEHFVYDYVGPDGLARLVGRVWAEEDF